MGSQKGRNVHTFMNFKMIKCLQVLFCYKQRQILISANKHLEDFDVINPLFFSKF